MIETAAHTACCATTPQAPYDLAILGSGSAAFAAAIRARSRGARVLMIERDLIGGTCVNVGCVPSKFLLHVAQRYHDATTDGAAGLDAAPAALDLAGIVERKAQLVAQLRRAKYEDLVEYYGFEFKRGSARFADAQTLEVDGETLRAANYLIATGSLPVAPPIPGLDEAGYLTSTTALELREVPARLAVVGGNAVGLELGQYFARVGSSVTILDVAERIAPFEEPEISAALSAALEAEHIAVLPGAAITSVSASAHGKVLHFSRDGKTERLEVDAILVATGRRPNTAHLGLDAAGVHVDPRGAVSVDEHLRTTNPAVFAAGDVTGAPQFVYVAGYEGSLAADNAAGSSRTVNLEALPRVIFSSPQIAAVGLTEAQAREQGIEIKVATLPVGDAVPRAIVNGSNGVIKMVADGESDRILGVHIAAESAAEVIQAATLAVKFRLTVADLLDTFHPYLTMAEGLKLTAQTFDRDVATLSCCAT